MTLSLSRMVTCTCVACSDAIQCIGNSGSDCVTRVIVFSVEHSVIPFTSSKNVLAQRMML